MYVLHFSSFVRDIPSISTFHAAEFMTFFGGLRCLDGCDFSQEARDHNVKQL